MREVNECVRLAGDDRMDGLEQEIVRTVDQFIYGEKKKLKKEILAQRVTGIFSGSVGQGGGYRRPIPRAKKGD